MVDPTNLPSRANTNPRFAGPHGSHRRGLAVVYIALILLILIFFVSIGVDMGRVRMARNQLATATDASALAGSLALPSADHSLASGNAVTVAAENACDGVAVAIQPANDIQYGLYRLVSHTYTPVGGTDPTGHTVVDSDANAIKVTALRMASRGNPIPLTFARAVGRSTFNVWTTATAFVRGGSYRFGIVGLDWIKTTGITNIDSYNPALGPYGGNNIHHNGSVASNGSINLVGSAAIHGDARPGINTSVYQTNNTTITGWTAPLDTTLSFPADSYSQPGTNNNNLVNPQSAIKANGDFDPANGTTTLPTTGGGTKYVFKSWKMSGSGVNVTINGPATIWISGTFTMTGGNLKVIGNDTNARVTFYIKGDFKQTGGSISNAYPNKPGTLTFDMTGANTTFDATAQLNAHIYAPLSDVKLTGNASSPPADFSGWLVGKTLTLSGNSQIHYDESQGGEDTPHRAILIK